jgi:hypothetical protein
MLQKRTCQLQNFAKEEELYVFVNRNQMSSLHDHFYEYKNNNEKRKKRPIGRVDKSIAKLILPKRSSYIDL